MMSSLRSLSLTNGAGRGHDVETPSPSAVGSTPPWAVDQPRGRTQGSCSSAAYGAVPPARAVGGAMSNFGAGGLVGVPVARPLTVNGGSATQPPSPEKLVERSVFSTTAPPRYTNGTRLGSPGHVGGPTTRCGPMNNRSVSSTDDT